jgi:AraC family transcriptional regulator
LDGVSKGPVYRPTSSCPTLASKFRNPGQASGARFWQVVLMRQRTEESYAKRIERVLGEIAGRLDEPLRLEDLAAVAGVSRFHFHRIFHAMTGETLAEVIRRLRLNRATWRLRSSSAAITEIAFEAGYESVEGFSRAFRQAFTIAPSAYRRAFSPPAMRPSNIRIAYRPETGAVRFIHLPGEHGMDVVIETFPREPALLLRQVGPYEHADKAHWRLQDWAASRGLVTQASKFLGLSHDDPEQVPREELRYDACVTVTEPVTDIADGIRCDILPGGRYATYLHHGSYAGFTDAFQRLFCLWLPESGEEVADGPCIERYLNDARVTPEAELETVLCIPLKD